MSFNFGANVNATSKFSVNLKPETYNPLIIAFNSKQIKGNKQSAKQNDNQYTNQGTKQSVNQGTKQSANQGTKQSANQGTKQNDPYRMLTQQMIVTNPYVDLDLDAEQRKIQNAACDYVLFVPTSFDVTKETVEAFYESIEKIKKMSGKMNMNHAAASIFLNRGMFE